MGRAERLVLCGGAPLPPRTKENHGLRLHLVGADKNVNLELANITKRLASNIPDPIADLLEIAAYIYAVDQAIARGGDGASDVGAGWRRQLDVRIAVRNPELWNSPAVKTAITSTLSFLSEDEFEFHFSKQQEPTPSQTYFEFAEDAENRSDIDGVLLFSGGVDSLGGAVKELSQERRLALVSHRSNPKIHKKQKHLVSEISRIFPWSPFHIPVWANKDKALGREHTQRTRSFLFACLAFAVAQAYDLDRIRFYENGVVSLNLPISEQLVGARATRTTHPQTLNGFAYLFSLIADSPFHVENPFLWLTKSEVFNVIGESGGAGLIKDSVSCTHTIDQTILHSHCGLCSQCVSRRFGALSSKFSQYDPVGIYKVDLLTGERQRNIDVTLIESFIRTAFTMRTLDDGTIIEAFGEIGRILRHVPEVGADAVATSIIELHRRHSADVSSVMEQALAAHAQDVLEKKLPLTSAIIIALPSDYRIASTAPAPETSTASPKQLFRKEGEFWTLVYTGTTVRVRHGKGVQYLSYLLGAPNKEISAVELVRVANGNSGQTRNGSNGDVLDDQALAEYKARADSLQSEIEEAKQTHDFERVELLRVEFEMLTSQIVSGTGFGGRQRPFGNDVERARKAVAAAINRTIRQIGGSHAGLARHLKDRVGFGTFLMYRGDSREWNA